MSVTVSDTHADTIRKALKYEPDDAAYSESSPWHPDRIRENALAALAAFVSEIERERARADRAEAALADDAAVMRGVAAVRKMGMLRRGDQHDHAEAFRAALSAGSGGLDAEVAQNARAGVGSDFDSGGGGSEPPSASSAAGSGGRETT